MKSPSFIPLAGLCLCTGLAVSGCGKPPKENLAPPPPTIITVTQAQTQDVPVIERSLGEIDSLAAPRIGAEVAGRIVKVFADVGDAVSKGQLLAEIEAADYRADAKRLEALAATQQRLTERYRELAGKGFVSPVKLEEVEAQNTAAREQYVRAAKNLARTRIVSPLDGRVDSRLVSEGDWIDLGKPVFLLSTSRALRISLPFPEAIAQRIKPGQSVKLSTPTARDQEVDGKISQLRPIVGTTNRAFDALVEVANPGGWRPGSSVNGEVLIEIHPGAVTVPEESIVLRPAGEVVYVVDKGKALQRVVKTGVKQRGYVEITDGLHAGERVAVDGAGYLTDKANVAFKQNETNNAGAAQ